MDRMRLYTLLLILFTFGLFRQSAKSQFSYTIHYTEKENLSSSKVYDMLEDSRGFMWFATEDGVSRFDGYDFVNYTHQNGLATNSTIKIHEDSKGRIWFLSYKGEISYFENGRIIQHWINPVIKNENLKMFDHIEVDTSGNLFLTGVFGGWMYCNEKDSTHSTYLFEVKNRKTYDYTIFFSPDPNKNIVGFFYDDNFGSLELNKTYPGLESFHFTNNKFYTYLQKQKLFLNNKSQLISLGPVLIYWDRDTIYKIKEFDGNIIAMTKDRSGNIWISVQSHATYFYNNGDFNKEPKKFFPNFSISKIAEDHEGNYWFSSTENGVFMVPGIQFKTYFTSTPGTSLELIIALEHDTDRLYFSTGNQRIFAATIEDQDLVIDKTFQPEGIKTTSAKDILVIPDGSIWIIGGEFLRFNRQGKHLPVKDGNRYSGYSLNYLWDSLIIMTTRLGYTTYDINGNQVTEQDTAFKIHTFIAAEDPDSGMLLGTIEGLFHLKNGKYYKITNPENLNHRITSIEKVGSTQWIGTFDYGLVILCPDTFYTITIDEGLPGNRIKTLFAENEHRIWVGGSKGLSRIDFYPKADQVYKINNFTIWDGLPSNEINNILLFKGLLWLATGNGLASFDPNKLAVNHDIPEVIMESVTINDESTNQNKRTSPFGYDENSITFNFRAHTFKNCNHIRYLYKLEGLENKWIESPNHTIRYSGLNAGNYNFLVKAIYYDGNISDQISHPFKIKKYFASTYFFKIAFILIALLLILGLVINYNKNQNKRRKLERQILLAEQNAVRAQMNPHFIFNSLNSIQNFILDNDAKNANLYLVIFSSLIRKILEASKQNFISIREEVETIKLYLELEKFRFENQFEYTINIHPKVSADQVAIPSMILQPYLENAIWHGLVPKKGKGVLELDVQENEKGLLLISITDNGIGRENAAIISKRRKHHKPTGIKNVEERLNLLNKMNDTHMTVEIIDLYDGESKACGTRVEFLIDI